MLASRIAAASMALVVLSAMAGDDSSGPTQYKLNLGTPFSTYQLTEKDEAWGQRLAQKFRYTSKIFYFVRTSLPLEVDGKTVEGAVYQRVDLPACFYVVPGDYVLTIGTPWPASPATGGFSLNAPKSRNFLACMNCHCGGVPALASTPITKGPVTWNGHNYSRF